MKKTLGAVVLVTSFAAPFAACGSLDLPDAPDSGKDSGHGNHNMDPVSVGDAGADACTATETVAVPPLSLLVLLDRSGTMSTGGRWTMTVQGLTAVFEDASFAGTRASLSTFPRTSDACAVGMYATPEVDLRPLPASQFAEFLAGVDAPLGPAPTRPALEGTFQYAATMASDAGAENVVVVLVTDGPPSGCTPDNTEEAVVRVTTAARPLRTVVVGVGGASETYVNAVADAGGPGVAIPVATAPEVASAFTRIRDTFGCSFPIGGDAPIDPAKVNVALPGAAEPLPYDADCADGGGWSAAPGATPPRGRLCPEACLALWAGPTQTIRVTSTCATGR